MKLDGDIIKNEPVLITGFVEAVLVLLLAFGVDLDNDKIAAIMAVVTIGLAILARKFTTPTNKVTPQPEAEDKPMFPEEPPPAPPPVPPSV